MDKYLGNADDHLSAGDIDEAKLKKFLGNVTI